MVRNLASREKREKGAIIKGGYLSGGEALQEGVTRAVTVCEFSHEGEGSLLSEKRDFRESS